jgi:hypothetical protein
MRLILVHGTFAAKAAWIRPDSTFVSQLLAGFPGRTEVVSFTWSGANNFRGRSAAVHRLQEVLRSAPAGCDQYVIAHSHGGNIAVDALKEPEVAARVRGTICLSTPFLQVRRREWSESVSSAMVIVLLVSLIFFTAEVIKWCCSVWAEAQPDLVEWLGLATMVAFVVAAWKLFNRLAAHTRPVRDAANRQVAAGVRLLILRTASDEAGAVLTVAQFISWITGHAFARIDRLAGRLSNLAWILFFSLFFGVVLLSYLYRAGVWFFSKLGLITGPLPADPFSLDQGSALSAAFETAMVVLGITIIAPAVLALFVAGIIIFVSASFGHDAMMAALAYDISVEASPPGSWTVHLLPVDLQPMHGSQRLVHSSYEDPRAVEAIREWIREQG